MIYQTLLISIKLFIVHPKALVISYVTHPLVLFLNIAIFYTIYDHSNTAMIRGYTLTQIIWYFNIVHMIKILISNNTDHRLSEQILSGELGNVLLRPISLFRFEFFNALTLRVGGLIFEVIPEFLIFTLIYPPLFLDFQSLCKFIPVVFLAFLIYFLISYLVGLSAIITQNNSSMRRLVFTVASILGGGMIPLDFFPTPLRNICEALPFQYIFYIPIQFCLNRDTAAGTDIWLLTLSTQFMWVVVLFGLCLIIWKLLMKRIVVVGG
ncbi:ABC transporter permease [Paenibacillus tarimensis]|nr:ABC-2 family transporter protein [Paenibacillus tarimensis]